MKKQLLILPFDHRSSFVRDVLGADYKKLKLGEKKDFKALKEIIYDGFLMAVKKYKNQDGFGILVDEESGLSILSRAKKTNVKICLPVEKSGVKEFKLEYGKNFGQHIKKIKPDYVKVLVRYNPLNKKINKKQLVELKKVSDYGEKNNYPLIFELLVPPTDKDLKLTGSKENYDAKLRIKRTKKAIKQIKKQIKITVWKLEGFDEKHEWKQIFRATGRKAQIIVLGRGEDREKVKKWLAVASRFEQVIGFAIGRTIFLQVLQNYWSKKISREQAISEIGKNFKYFVKYWEKLQTNAD